MLQSGLKPQTLLQGLVLDGEAGSGKPQIGVEVAWHLGVSPVGGGDESGGRTRERVFGAGGSCGGGGGVVREFVAMKDVSGLGGARTSVPLGIGAMLVLGWSGR